MGPQSSVPQLRQHLEVEVGNQTEIFWQSFQHRIFWMKNKFPPPTGKPENIPRRVYTDRKKADDSLTQGPRLANALVPKMFILESKTPGLASGDSRQIAAPPPLPLGVPSALRKDPDPEAGVAVAKRRAAARVVPAAAMPGDRGGGMGMGRETALRPVGQMPGEGQLEGQSWGHPS